MNDYFRLGHVFQKRLSTEALSHREARYLFFRIACPSMQNRFPRFVDLSAVPKTFIHGNPHLDNYVKTFHGSAMLDFDRSRIGPYCWDIVRFLSSLSLRREETDGFLDRKVVECFLDAYILHFLSPEIPAKQVKMLKGVEPQKWQMTSRYYLQSNKRWAKKMRDNALDPSDPTATTLLKKFLESRNELTLLNDYKVSEIGLTPGSLGKKHFIFALMPKNEDSRSDAIILDIKEVYTEKDNKFFYSPSSHHGERMILASKIFADGMEDRLGFCTLDNKQYWGRQVPSFAVKVKKFLNKEEQCDFAYSVGSELGKGHRKGLLVPEDYMAVEKDLLRNFDKYYKVSKLFTYELNLSYEALMKRIKLYQAYRSW
ncbi:MAG: DUF2252 domain-containing protein [Bacteriovoracaceae bacterium]|nr:DUF2252 domain-containing protein [Bacteriovoracaceae bacterium]